MRSSEVKRKLDNVNEVLKKWNLSAGNFELISKDYTKRQTNKDFESTYLQVRYYESKNIKSELL